MHHRDDTIKVGAHDVHFVDIGHAGHAIPVGLTPHGLGLRLDAALGTENGDGAVQYAKRPFDFNREIHMSRCIDDVDAVVLPMTGGGGGGDGDSTLLLLLHPVHGGSAVMHLSELVGDPGVIQNPLGRRRLSGVDMGHDAYIARQLKRKFSWHSFLLF
ncbi:hypothetical protein SDC9_64919 [bioreactor metagenome]|uniref:Uncharacterized protein n=1 Tax=bioreactor metagenome TaxID=1076179 RepID=A0A644XRH3_9ZZZZ